MTSIYSHRSNFGLAWSRGQYKILQALLGTGMSMTEASKKMGRSPNACVIADRFTRRMDMYLHGKANETLVSWRKKQND